MADAPTGGGGGGGGGSILTKKIGPAPAWVWMLAVLGVALAFMMMRKPNSSEPVVDEETTSMLAYDDSQMPPNVFIINEADTPPTTPTGPTKPGIPKPTLPTQPGIPETKPTPPKKTPPPAPPVRPPARPKPAAPKIVWEWYTAKKGDNLSSIAKRYGTTWQTIWEYNLRPGVRPAATQKTLKERGPNLMYSGTKWLVPVKK